MKFIVYITSTNGNNGNDNGGNGKLSQVDNRQDLQSLKSLIAMCDKVNDKAKEYIKDVIRLEMDNNKDVQVSFDDFISIYPYINHASFVVDVHIPKEDYEANEWCKRACTMLNLLIPHAIIYLDESTQ